MTDRTAKALPDGPLPQEPLAAHARELFGSAYLEYHSSLERFLRRRVRNEADVADIAQETYLRLLRYHDREDMGALKGLLYRIATNLVLLRARSIRNRGSDRDITIDEDLLLPASDPSPERQLLGEQQLARLLAALKSLPEKCQEVFVLSRFQNLPHAEIALRCGISVKMVEKHLARALEICHQVVGNRVP